MTGKIHPHPMVRCRFTRAAVEDVMRMINQRATLEQMFINVQYGHQLFLKRDLRSGEEGRTSSVFLDSMTAEEVAAIHGMLQTRIDKINENLLACGLVIVE